MIINIAIFFFLSMAPTFLQGMLLNPDNNVNVVAINEIFNNEHVGITLQPEIKAEALANEVIALLDIQDNFPLITASIMLDQAIAMIKEEACTELREKITKIKQTLEEHPAYAQQKLLSNLCRMTFMGGVLAGSAFLASSNKELGIGASLVAGMLATKSATVFNPQEIIEKRNQRIFKWLESWHSYIDEEFNFHLGMAIIKRKVSLENVYQRLNTKPLNDFSPATKTPIRILAVMFPQSIRYKSFIINIVSDKKYACYKLAQNIVFAMRCAHYIKILYDAECALKYTQCTNNKDAILKKQLELVEKLDNSSEFEFYKTTIINDLKTALGQSHYERNQ